LEESDTEATHLCLRGRAGDRHRTAGGIPSGESVVSGSCGGWPAVVFVHVPGGQGASPRPPPPDQAGRPVWVGAALPIRSRMTFASSLASSGPRSAPSLGHRAHVRRMEVPGQGPGTHRHELSGPARTHYGPAGGRDLVGARHCTAPAAGRAILARLARRHRRRAPRTPGTPHASHGVRARRWMACSASDARSSGGPTPARQPRPSRGYSPAGMPPCWADQCLAAIASPR